jgi:hypothetical protein
MFLSLPPRGVSAPIDSTFSRRFFRRRVDEELDPLVGTEEPVKGGIRPIDLDNDHARGLLKRNGRDR